MTRLDVFGDPLPESWPQPLHPAALHGVAGDYVTECLPHTETDPAALLVAFLVSFGNLVGRGAHWRAGAKEHHAMLQSVSIARTGGQKGDAIEFARAYLRPVDPEWEKRIDSGVTSGEGLIRRLCPKGDGPADRRLLVHEAEFGGALARGGRDGSSLSSTLREMFDGGQVGNMTKHDPDKVRDYHVSLWGNVTPSELRDRLGRGDLSNGFANRILWLVTNRSKSLPSGGEFDKVDRTPIVKRLSAAAAAARSTRLVRRTPEAEAFWEGIYSALTRPVGGVFGGVTSRGHVHTMRLALVYMLLDSEREITLDHLLAGLAVWTYAEDSAWYMWGERSGSRDADTLLRGLRAEGSLKRSELNDLFGTHPRSGRLDAALDVLEDTGMAKRVRVPTGGRPAEVWEAVPRRADSIRRLLPTLIPLSPPVRDTEGVAAA